MEERNDSEKMEEIMLPGFRFHPTDEELVGFYLKRKIQQRPLSIELIKQLDIYKYDPWDLPKLATTGEKEWYFYCPRDRKYRNSARPNRVTGAGFWKATGTDRPIYSSEGSKCIGLKKSLVFYKGRAAKGIKTDWMMHEFRLPSLTDSATPKRSPFMDKNLPANDSWAICRIFKKTNSTAQRALSHSWVSPLPETATSDMANNRSSLVTQLSTPEDMSILTTKTSSATHQFNHDIVQQTSSNAFSPLDNYFSSYSKPMKLQMGAAAGKPPHHHDHLPPMSSGDLSSLIFAPQSAPVTAKCTVDVTSVLLNMSSSMLGDDYGKASDQSTIDFGGSQEQCSVFSSSVSFPHEIHGNNIDNGVDHHHQWEPVRSVGFPFSLPMTTLGLDAWKPNMFWDSSSCPSEMPASFSATKCYT